MQALLGEESGDFLRGYTQPAEAGLRTNPLKISPAQFQMLTSFQLHPLPWCPEGFTLQAGEGAGRHPFHAAGLYYLQEPSAMAPAEMLEVQPGEHVLDLAAAPGGKATHLAARLQGQGLLLANEIHPQRVWQLTENLERWSATNAVVTQADPEDLAARLAGFFDRVLLDAPCSGEGMFRKSEAARRAWSPALVSSCALRQGSILETAASFLRPGGYLVYSTCTFNRAENEAVIEAFLASHPDFALNPGPAHVTNAAAPGLIEGPTGAVVRFWPQRHLGEGHFIARLQRKGQNHEQASEGKGRPHARSQFRLERESLRLFHQFCDQALFQGRHTFPGECLAQVGTYLYRIPPNLPDLSGLRVIHPGWWLGTAKKERFEPSHALALGLAPGEVRQRVDFAVDAPEVAAYLNGQALRTPGADGWALVTVGGFSLGWAHRVQGVLKNFYPRGLRLMS